MGYKDRNRQRQYQREHIARVRKDWLDANGPCKECGTWDDLEVDHIDKKTKVSHNVWSWSKLRRDAELAKCQVLCRKHHVIKTWTVDRKRAVHGSLARYRKYKCRCSECRAVKSTADREYRDSKRFAPVG